MWNTEGNRFYVFVRIIVHETINRFGAESGENCFDKLKLTSRIYLRKPPQSSGLPTRIFDRLDNLFFMI